MDNKLIDIFARVLNVPAIQITPDTSMNNTAKWDSLKHMSLITSIEEEFALVLTAEEIMSMTSIDIIVNILKTKGKIDADK